MFDKIFAVNTRTCSCGGNELSEAQCQKENHSANNVAGSGATVEIHSVQGIKGEVEEDDELRRRLLADRKNWKAIGIDCFGASSPIGEIYKEFDITKKAIIVAAKELS
ncbi:hypothetical protein AHAS_Ahas01G0162900 [Arachis hypogaea]